MALFGIPVTIIMWVGRLKMAGIGKGNSPWKALAVKDKAHNFLLTPLKTYNRIQNT
jgi:hypothetical protein